MSDLLNSPIATPATPAPESKSWLSAITDSEIVGHIQNRGWDKLDPQAAAIEAIKAFRGAEKLVGAPPEQMLRIPKADDEAAQKAFWQRLGAPEKPEGYEFEGIEFDDPEWTRSYTEAVRQAAAEMHMPKEMAERMAQRIFKFAADKGAAREADSAANLEADRRSLVQEWGDPDSARFRANMFVADKAIDALGISAEEQQKLMDSIGRMKVARLFHRIGSAMGEDKFVAGTAPANSGVMTRDQAVSRKAELMSDRDWGRRLFSGGQAERKELDALVQIIASNG